MTAYRRKCKHCGRFINMRQMPGGHWVAFEGYNTVHDCDNPPKEKNTGSYIKPTEQPGKSGYDDLGIIDVEIKGGPIEKKPEKPVSQPKPIKGAKKEEKLPTQPQRPFQYSSPGSKSERSYGWIWIVVAIIILWLLIKR